MSAQYIYVGGTLLRWGDTPLSMGEPTTAAIWPGPFVAGEPAGSVWTWSVGPGASASAPGADRELTEAYGRVATWRVDGHAFATFTIDGRSDEAAGIVERRDDLWIRRDGVLVFRGRIVGAEDAVDASTHVTQFAAVDYRAMLSGAAKVEPSVPTFSAVDQGQIVWQLIQGWQALSGGDWGITQGVGSTSGVTRDETDITPFSPVGEVIDSLLRRDGGGEWEISPTMELNRWWPRRGSASGEVLDYGGVLDSVGRSLPEFGNAAGATGGQGTAAVVSADAGVGADDRGRWTVAQGYPSVSKQSTVAAKASWLLDQASTVQSEWRATFSPGRWGGLGHVWIGDTVEMRVDSGRLSVAGAHRVVELQAVCGDHGTETITVGIVGVPA